MTHIYEAIAAKAGETPEEVYAAIQEAITASDLPSLPPELFISILAHIVVE